MLPTDNLRRSLLRSFLMSSVLFPVFLRAETETFALQAPTILQPAENSSLKDNTPSLCWSAPGAEEVEIWMDGRRVETLPAGKAQYTPFPLSYGQHQWKIVARSAKSTRESEVHRFKVEDAPLSKVPEGALLLRENWYVASAHEVGMNGALLSSGKTQAANWARTSLPATALTALVRAGIYGNPYTHTNLLRVPDSSDRFNKQHDLLKYSHIPGKNPWTMPYWFVRDFELGQEQADGRLWLNLGEINYRAEVWLNGRQLAGPLELVGMERSFRLDITKEVLRGKTNHLAIAIHPVDSPGMPAKNPSTPLAEPGNNMGEDGLICLNYAKWDTLGWDWQPSIPDRDMGITEDVFITRTADLELADVHVAPQLSLGVDNTAEILTNLELLNHGTTAEQVKLEGRISNENGLSVTFIQELSLPAGAMTKVELDASKVPALRLKNPPLWWPAGLGSPSLHSMEVSLLKDGHLLSKRQVNFGIRKIDTELKDGVRSFSVNGKLLFMRGGNWVADMLLGWTASRYEREIELARHANLNFLRVWGPTGVPPQAFFDAADRNGILIWQDFLHDHWGTFNNRQGYFPYLNLFLDASTDIIRRLRNHPSLFLWCGGNEGPNPREDWLVGKLLPENDPKGGRHYLPASLSDGLQGGGPYHNILPKAYFETPKLTGFNSEVGPSGVPEWESLGKFLDVPSKDWAKGRFPVSSEWAFHDATNQASPTDPRKFSHYDDLVRNCYGMPEGTGAEQMLAYSLRTQLVNYDAYRAAIESLNRAMWNKTTGFALWKFNAGWPSLTWQISDWYMQTHAGYYAVRKACAPVHVQMDRDTQKLRLVNRGEANLKGVRVEARLFSMDMKPLWSAKDLVEVAANASLELASTVPESSKVSFLKLEAYDNAGALLAENFYWLQKDDRFSPLSKLQAPTLGVTVGNGKKAGTAWVKVQNTGKSPALLVRAKLVEADTLVESLPSLWSDNYLFLLPGETREIAVELPQGTLPAKAAITLQGWNFKPVTLPLK